MMLLNPTIIIGSIIAAVAAVTAAWISPTAIIAVIAAVIAAGAAITEHGYRGLLKSRSFGRNGSTT
jgi:hypothetical protein